MMNDLVRVEQTVERFCPFISTLSPHARVDQAWGPKEVLAHRTYQHDHYVAISPGGRPVSPPAGRFR